MLELNLGNLTPTIDGQYLVVYDNQYSVYGYSLEGDYWYDCIDFEIMDAPDSWVLLPQLD